MGVSSLSAAFCKDYVMSITYTVELFNPQAHLFKVVLSLKNPMSNEQLLMLPTWIPGSYMIRDMAADLIDIKAISANGEIEATKIDKTTWRVPTGEQPGELQVVYTVFAKDLSVRLAYFDQNRAFFNPTSLCLCPIGLEKEPMTIEINPGSSDETKRWKVATSLPRIDKKSRWQFGVFQAKDYDELADSPFEIGLFDLLSFKTGGAEHFVAVTGAAIPYDKKRLVEDLKCCCQATVELFEPKSKKAPFKDYLFLLNLDDHLYGGLEHRQSTALIASYYDLPQKDTTIEETGYQHLLGLCTHEYFHAWWVKRVKPSTFLSYDYHGENYTRLLWVFEGFTSYYDDLLLYRTGRLSKDGYCKSIAKVLNRHLWGAGRLHQSLSESSFDAWTKYYKTVVNRQNTVTSYYDKGALVALALDSYIQEKTKGKKSLDDVLRYAWYLCKEAEGDYAGVDEEAMMELIYDATGVDVADKLQTWVESCQEPDWKKVLKVFGIKVSQTLTDPIMALGFSVKGEEKVIVGTVIEKTAAQKAGLSEGDWLVAWDNIHVTGTNLGKLTKVYSGQTVKIHIIRNERLYELTLVVNQTKKETFLLK